MSLRERFALHGRAAMGRSELTVARADERPAHEPGRGLAEASPPPRAEAPGLTGPPVPRVRAPELRARGTAYGHGVYRLFVHGRAPRRPVDLPQVSGVELGLVLAESPSRAHPPSPRESPRSPPQRDPTASPPTSPGSRPRLDDPGDPAAQHGASATPSTGEPPREVAEPLAFGPDLGGYLRRVVIWPRAHAARPALLGGALACLELPDSAACQAMLPRLLARPIADARPTLVFVDVETTALDRGAGALAFMIGLAVLVDGGVQVEQWILTRLSSEAAMLADLLARLTALAGAGAVLSSFNGASFDLPLLRTRLRRAGLAAVALERPHLDLLPPARRMWRGHGSDCRLVTLERTQLGVRRVHDIAGHEIPAVFWAWLRRPEDPEVQAVMRRVADHNLADLVTLPALAAALHARITAPPDLDAAVRAAEHHLAAGRRGEALALLERWQAAAIRPGAPPAQRRRALLLAAELLRREPASRARAARLWAEVCRISPGDPAAHEALAKHLEHHAGDLAGALEVARSSAAPCPRRLVRLQRKLIARLPSAAASGA